MVLQMVKKIWNNFKGLRKIAAVGLVFILGGCMYPDDKLQQNQIPYQDQVESVQRAVKEYQKDNGGILPIVTKDKSTPYYVKYVIDFKKIVPKYIAEVPGNAFENGGIFQYTIIDEEKNPTVKLIDIRMAEKLKEIRMQIQTQGYPAFDEKIAKNVYTLNYEKMGFKEQPTVKSPFTGQSLYVVMAGDGELYVDYTPDLYKKGMDKKAKIATGKDIRHLLTDDSLFVPAFSLPYTWDQKSNKPVFMANEE